MTVSGGGGGGCRIGVSASPHPRSLLVRHVQELGRGRGAENSWFRFKEPLSVVTLILDTGGIAVVASQGRLHV